MPNLVLCIVCNMKLVQKDYLHYYESLRFAVI